MGVVWARVTPRYFAWQAWHNHYIHLRFTWPAWHRLASTYIYAAGVVQMTLGGALDLGLGARDAAPFCVAGVAQPYIPSFHVAGMAQTRIYRRFTWQAWYRWHWVARLALVRFRRP